MCSLGQGCYRKKTKGCIRNACGVLLFTYVFVSHQKKDSCPKIVQPIASSSSHWVLSAPNRILLLKSLIAALPLKMGTSPHFYT
jgi:hypothetical protein